MGIQSDWAIDIERKEANNVACMSIFAQPTAMATTQLARRICFEDSPAKPIEQIVERPQLSMNWVVVTDENGKRQLRMRWTVGNDTGAEQRL